MLTMLLHGRMFFFCSCTWPLITIIEVSTITWQSDPENQHVKNLIKNHPFNQQTKVNQSINKSMKSSFNNKMNDGLVNWTFWQHQ